MGNNDKLKEIDINSCTCYYFEGIIKLKSLILITF